jgi:ubiquinone/menaquinone biosynthesis C-methylase UbiE
MSAYLPALRFRALTRVYDPVIALTTRERAFRAALADVAAPAAGEDVLDVGCGTGSLAALLAARAPGARITGVDADPEMLARARAKSPQTAFREARAEALPFADGSFDLAVSSLFFHHLLPGAKRAVAAEVLRVLRPGGRLAVADWGAPGDPLMWLASRSIRLLDGEPSRDSLAGALPAILAESGFDDVRERDAVRTPLGRVVIQRAAAPPRSADA